MMRDRAMTGRAGGHGRAGGDAAGDRAWRRADHGWMGDRGMAAVELGVALAALAAAILLAVARG